ncbi:Bug family tripartite tricarboxylate transporter substrate binding protein [Falsiroseomonas stagni]|uniref:Tripartite-type tricarboxylate transporter, receptor component TctC n=1 Tax=Falsiroseomonas stagni DSM 19981 TaxID=1123062 RepID=A0A1I4F4G4_9PROT|nr:tripartite tricarboxylate transporter substrate binding protein [Falsiroseomonas stagni]SFL11737.1 Tripartite-type tricarboxylate transporter, receptor component TctC [Falsiroseomonas stagni DSM 19981]
MMRPTRRALLASAILAPSIARAQDGYPTRPIRLVVPWPPGGPIDLAARPIAARMAELLGQPVVIENRGGANGTIGALHVSQAAPDGYTLLVASPGPVSISPLARGQAALEPLRIFAPVCQLVSSPSALVVRKDLPARDLAALIALAKARPGALTYGSAGPASINHLSAATLAARGGAEMLHIPYQGAAPLLTDLIAGRIDMAFLGIGVALPLVTQGNARALAVGNLRRAAAMPDVPTVAETYPGFQADNWYGILAPLGTPRGIIQRLHRDAAAAVRTPAVTRAMVEAGNEPAPSESPETFAAMIAEDLERWRDSVRAAGLRPE